MYYSLELEQSLFPFPSSELTIVVEPPQLLILIGPNRSSHQSQAHWLTEWWKHKGYSKLGLAYDFVSAWVSEQCQMEETAAYLTLVLWEPYPIQVESVHKRSTESRSSFCLFVFFPWLKGLLSVLHVFISIVNPSARLFTYFAEIFLGFK